MKDSFQKNGDLTYVYKHNQDFLGVPVVKNLSANAGGMGSIPSSGRSAATLHLSP